MVWLTPSATSFGNELNRAAKVLNSGQKVVMLVGASALHGTDRIIDCREVRTALLGNAAMPDGLPFAIGSIGLLSTAASRSTHAHGRPP